MHKLSLIVLCGVLTACSSAPPETLSKIDALQVPVVQSGPATGSPEQAQALYQQNKQTLDTVSQALKAEYLQDVKPKEIFDLHSQAHQVYVSLSKLDEVDQINRYYLQHQNISGLQKVNDSLKSLEQG